MATDLIITDGDQVLFSPVFTPAIVIVRPGIIRGTGKTTIGGKGVCIAGDEESVKVAGCMYTSGPFTQPGLGTLKIVPFSSAQLTKDATDNGDSLIKKGTIFNAVFEVVSAAIQILPTGPDQDKTAEYTGKAQFVTNNFKIRAS